MQTSGHGRAARWARWIGTTLGWIYFVLFVVLVAAGVITIAVRIFERGGPAALLEASETVAIMGGGVAAVAGALWLWEKTDAEVKRVLLLFGFWSGVAVAIIVFWNTPPIGSVPLAQLTLSALWENALKALALIGCFYAFIKSI